MLQGDLQCDGRTEAAVALTAQSTTKGHNPIICINCKHQGHMGSYCIHLGGSMAGKTIEELKEAHRKDKESKMLKTPTPSSLPTDTHVKVSVKGSDGHAYLLLADPSSLTPISGPSDLMPKEFVGITSINLELVSTEYAEYHRFMAMIQEEFSLPNEHMFNTNVNWTIHSNWTDFSTISVMGLSQVPIPIKAAPFLIDSGASSGISPDKKDFTNLKPLLIK